MVLLLTQKAVVICKQITHLILYNVTSMLLTLLKLTDAFIQVCHTDEKVKCEVRYILDSLYYSILTLN